MPRIKVEHVVSVSSEDKGNEGTNILCDDSSKSWRCSAGGHDRVSIVLQFAKAAKITAVDVGNNGAAFVEILVGRLSDTEQSYKVLLAMSSFMTPMEGRNGTPTNRVRIFGPDSFTKEVAEETWDRVKIVCTQPFNKTAQYGLSFVKFTTPGDADDAEASGSAISKTTEPVKMGAFVLKADDVPTLTIGSYFTKRNESQSLEEDTLSGAAAIRAASVKAESRIMSRFSNAPPVKRKAPPENEDEPLEKKKTILPSQSQSGSSKIVTKAGSPQSASKKLSAASSSSKTKQQPRKEPKSEEAESPGVNKVPFKRLMASVVIAMSGFQNPLRGQLRDQALEMGAKYRPDWDDSCTHLVCAFANTPKYNQVKAAGGSIVSQNWILDCYKKKVALPWRRYRIGGNSPGNSRSPSPPARPDVTTKSPSTPATSKASVPNSASKQSSHSDSKNGDKCDVIDDDYGASTDVDSGGEDHEEDTDDEIRRAVESGATKTAASAVRNRTPSPLVDTSALPVPQLPDYFRGKCFFLYGKFEADERRSLARYLTAFNGILSEYMDTKVGYVITDSDWDDNFDEALVANDHLIFVKPRWIYACATQKRLVPYQAHVVAPRDA